MANPLLLPPRLLLRALDDLHAIATAAERVPEVERRLFERLDALDRLETLDRLEELERAIAALPEAIEQILRRHFESQVEGIRRLHPELVASKENTAEVPPLMETLTKRIKALQAEMAAVREAVEPLRPAAERLDRLTDRIPGTG